LDLDIRPGDLIYKGDVIGETLNPFGRTVTQIRAPVTGIIIGITTQPITVPGTGIAHVARLKKTLSVVERSMRKAEKKASKKKPRRGRRRRTASKAD
jgi:predicted deacylase